MLSPRDRNGNIAILTISTLSAVATVALLVYTLVRPQRLRAMGFFYLLLVFWELVQAIGWLINIRWLILDDVKVGTTCFAQGILKQLAASGTSLASIGLSWCILRDIVFQSREPRLRRAMYIWGVMLALQALLLVVPSAVFKGAQNFYGLAGPWCWIPDSRHVGWRIGLHYIFYWTSWVFSFLTGLAYLASAYVGRRLPCGYFWIGFPSRSNGLLRMGVFSELPRDGREPRSGFTFDVFWFGATKSVLFIQYLGPPPEQVPLNDVESLNSGIAPQRDRQPADQGGTTIRNALMLLAFPLIYGLLITPFSIVRFVSFTHHSVSSTAETAVGAVWSAVGFMDVVLFIILQPNFGLRLPALLTRRHAKPVLRHDQDPME